MIKCPIETIFAVVNISAVNINYQLLVR